MEPGKFDFTKKVRRLGSRAGREELSERQAKPDFITPKRVRVLVFFLLLDEFGTVYILIQSRHNSRLFIIWIRFLIMSVWNKIKYTAFFLARFEEVSVENRLLIEYMILGHS